MKVFTYSEARQNLAKILQLARSEEVEIRRKDGFVFSLRSKAKSSTSPFDVSTVKTEATTKNILDAIRYSRAGDKPTASAPHRKRPRTERHG